jgi:hypothetical protein
LRSFEKQGNVLRRPESERWRIVVFIAVVGLHCLAAYILIASRTLRIAGLRANGNLVLLRLPQERPPPTFPLPQAPTHYRQRVEPIPTVDQPPDVNAPEPSNAITIPFESGADAEAAAKRLIEKQDIEKRRKNLAGPSESQLEWWKGNAPLTPDHPSAGDREHSEGGEQIEWTNDKCFYTTRTISADGTLQGGKICKDPPKPATDLFKDMRKTLEDRAKASVP